MATQNQYVVLPYRRFPVDSTRMIQSWRYKVHPHFC